VIAAAKAVLVERGAVMPEVYAHSAGLANGASAHGVGANCCFWPETDGLLPGAERGKADIAVE
jgi:hypothetical protein